MNSILSQMEATWAKSNQSTIPGLIALANMHKFSPKIGEYCQKLVICTNFHQYFNSDRFIEVIHYVTILDFYYFVSQEMIWINCLISQVIETSWWENAQKSCNLAAFSLHSWLKRVSTTWIKWKINSKWNRYSNTTDLAYPKYVHWPV